MLSKQMLNTLNINDSVIQSSIQKILNKNIVKCINVVKIIEMHLPMEFCFLETIIKWEVTWI